MSLNVPRVQKKKRKKKRKKKSKRIVNEIFFPELILRKEWPWKYAVHFAPPENKY